MPELLIAPARPRPVRSWTGRGGYEMRRLCILSSVFAATSLWASLAPAGLAGQEGVRAGVALASVPDSAESDPDDAPARLILSRHGEEEFAVAPISGVPNEQLPVVITVPRSTAVDYQFLAFRDLPAGFSLSAGFGVAEAWFVSVPQARDLYLQPPEGYVGAFTMKVQLVRGQKSEPLTQPVPVSISPVISADPGDPTVTAALEPAVVSPKPEADKSIPAPADGIEAKQPSPDPALEKRLLTLADTLLGQKDIAAAQLVYARLAREGSAAAALALAQTYDPAFLSEYGITGLRADEEKARRWYELAASLGSADAPERLVALGRKD